MLRYFARNSRARARWKPPDSLALSNYSAGTLWTPPKVRDKLNLQEEYTGILESVVSQNQAKLAAHYGLVSAPESKRTLRTILNRLQTDFYGPTKEADADPMPFTHSRCPAKQYNAFLRQLYAETPKFPKILAAMADLPQPAARYIHPVHMRDMLAISRKLKNFESYFATVEELERVSYKFSSFDRAEILLMMSKAHGPMKRRFGEKYTAWRSHFSGGDLRILNTLFNAGLNSNSAQVQTFVLDEIMAHGLQPDRFTYHCRMRRARDSPVELKSTFRDFCDQGLVIDVTTLYIMMQGLLHSGYISAAESFLNQLLRNHQCLHTVPSNPNKLSMLLWMIDRTRQLCDSSSEGTPMVSLVPDDKVLIAFANKYIQLGEFSKLCDILKTLANHGYPARDLIYRISKAFRHQWALQEFDVFLTLVLDISGDLPLMTEPLAKNLDQLHQKFRPTEDSIYDLCLAFT